MILQGDWYESFKSVNIKHFDSSYDMLMFFMSGTFRVFFNVTPRGLSNSSDLRKGQYILGQGSSNVILPSDNHDSIVEGSLSLVDELFCSTSQYEGTSFGLGAPSEQVVPVTVSYQ